MPRKLRVDFAGALYHVMYRGNQGQAIFKDDQDRQRCTALAEDPTVLSRGLGKLADELAWDHDLRAAVEKLSHLLGNGNDQIDL